MKSLSSGKIKLAVLLSAFLACIDFKKFKKHSLLLLSVLLIASAGSVFANGSPGTESTPVSFGGITPYIIAGTSSGSIGGNRTCVDVGTEFFGDSNYYAFSSGRINYNGGFDSTFPADLTVDIENGTFVSWNSTFGIGSVIVKGGNNANVYVYDPQWNSDSNLASPPNPSGGFSGLSNLTFCLNDDGEVGKINVSKSAETSFTRTWEWEIEKSVTPEIWNLLTGNSGTSEYTVKITKTDYTDSDWAVQGAITIYNPTESTATITSISDTISGGINVTPDCGDVAFPYSLVAGGTLNCTYSNDLDDGTSRTNTATVTTFGVVGGGSGTADIIFGEPTYLINDEINVTDSFEGVLGTFTGSDSVNYTRTFTCDGDEGTHNNTATIIETEQSNSALVTINCSATEADPTPTPTPTTTTTIATPTPQVAGVATAEVEPQIIGLADTSSDRTNPVIFWAGIMMLTIGTRFLGEFAYAKSKKSN